MNFFQKLFGKATAKEETRNQPSLTPDQFFNTDYIKQIISEYKRTTTLLKPHTSAKAIDESESKFGGGPNCIAFNEYPCCDACEAPLNFVLQLYKKDFPSFYFPNDSTLFQLFRCPNNDCTAGYSDKYDHKMFHYYFKDEGATSTIPKPLLQLANAEQEVPDCYLKPTITLDFPNYDDCEDDIYGSIEDKFGKELLELFEEKYSAIPNTKLGGYPSFTQSLFYPTCSCGKEKEFFFQLASEDPEDGAVKGAEPYKWSAHGIMIGDVGNIYYYVCKPCGQHTIESYWDCF